MCLSNPMNLKNPVELMGHLKIVHLVELLDLIAERSDFSKRLSEKRISYMVNYWSLDEMRVKRKMSQCVQK